MKILLPLILLFCTLSAPAWAGQWVTVNEDTLMFVGTIEKNDYLIFMEHAYTPKIKNLIVISSGGISEVAIQIAEVLENVPDLKVTVRGKCISACANFFFAAAKVRVIENGIVGFHGNTQGCYLKDEATLEKTKKNFIEMGLSEAEALAEIAELQAESVREKAFFERQGISQELFDLSCIPDKGTGDGKIYSFLLPSAETFEKYGLKNITGTQSESAILNYRGALLVK